MERDGTVDREGVFLLWRMWYTRQNSRPFRIAFWAFLPLAKVSCFCKSVMNLVGACEL